MRKSFKKIVKLRAFAWRLLVITGWIRSGLKLGVLLYLGKNHLFRIGADYQPEEQVERSCGLIVNIIKFRLVLILNPTARQISWGGHGG